MTPAPIEAPHRLAVGEAVTGDASRPRPHRYDVEVPAGHYLHVVARQLGVDVLLRLVPPSGEPVLEVDSPTGERGEETAHAVAAADGVWTVEVDDPEGEEAEEWPEGGGYEIVLADLRPATDEDRLRTETEAAIARGDMLKRADEKGQREAYAEALALAERLGAPDRLAYVLYRLGDAEADAGRRAEAMPLYERSLALSRELGDEEAQGKLHNRIAGLERRAGRLDRALNHQRQSIRFFRHLQDEELLADALAVHGQTLDWAGQPREALAALHESIDLAQRLGLGQEETKAHAWLGDVHLGLEQLDLAADEYGQAAALARRIGYRTGEVLAERGLAARWTRAGDAERAIPHLRRALALLAEQRDKEQIRIAVLGDLGSAELQRGDVAAAVAALEEALSLARRGGYLRHQAFALHKLGRCREREGDHRESARLHAEAAELFARIGDRNSEAGARYGQALALGRLGELGPAVAALEGGLLAADEVRRSTGGHELQTSFAASKQHYRELHVDLLMALDRRDPGAGHALAALTADDRGRSRALVDLLDRSAADAAAVSPELVAERQSLEKSLESLRRFGQRLSERGETEAVAEVERRQREILTRLDRVRAESRSAAASTVAPVPPWTGERIDALLDGDTLLLVYSLGEERSFLWALWRGGRQRIELPPRGEIEPEAMRAASAFARLGETARESGERAAAELARRVLEPVAGRLLRHRRVVVIADGALLHVPFAALPDPASGVPLVANHELVSVPSLTVLERLRQRPAPAAWKGAAAVVADPVFAADDPRVAGGPGAAEPPSPAVGGGVLVTRALEDLGLGRFSRLPGTRAEAEALLAALPEGSSVFSAFDFAASREAVLGGALAGYRVVHLATHGVLDRRTPSLSGLVFSLVDEAGRPRDGYLPLHEIHGLRLDAEMVVLSACHSGSGREMNGEGLVGLTRGFLEAGVPRLVVSLWQVGDQGSAELMRRFYRAWLADGRAPAEALAEAQRSMWRDPEWNAPYHWAAFQLVGDWVTANASQASAPDDPFEKRESGADTESDEDDDLPGPTLREPPKTSERDDDDVLYPNGVGLDGRLAWRPVRLEEIETAGVRHCHERPDPDEVFRRLRPGLSEDDLAEAGWAVVHPPGYGDVIDELEPLLRLRAREAGAAYRQPIEIGRDEEIDDFYKRLGVSWGAADPDRLPYYLLILGSPDEISFGKQQVLGQARAVGRLFLERAADYGTYARNVVAAEERPRRERPEATFFAAVNGDDRATRRTRDQLVAPLSDRLEEAHPHWRVRRLADEAASKGRLLSLFTDEAPPLLFTATHGLAVPYGDPRQRDLQGALIASDWRGDGSDLSAACYLTGDELPGELGFGGGLAFLFACYGAGTPKHDGFWFKGKDPSPRRTADPPFVARFVQSLLSRRGGPGAVIGHVDRAWTSSFFWHRAGQVNAFYDTLAELIRGARIGNALTWLHDLGRDAVAYADEMGARRVAGEAFSQSLFDRQRLAAVDARNFVVCGDPAVRLPVL